jgi:hypothetical protein
MQVWFSGQVTFAQGFTARQIATQLPASPQ